MNNNGDRYQAWRDGLPTEELVELERIEEMPPQMAIAYVYTELSRRIDELHRPLWRQALAPVAVAGAFVAGLLGLSPRELGG